MQNSQNALRESGIFFKSLLFAFLPLSPSLGLETQPAFFKYLGHALFWHSYLAQCVFCSGVGTIASFSQQEGQSLSKGKQLRYRQ